MRCHQQAIDGGVGLVVVTLLLVTISAVQLAPAVAGSTVRRPTTAPALYVFGDSIVDVGNNNHLPGTGVPRANTPYYGVDFPGGARPTGRWSNGYNVADLIAKAMGFDQSPPAYLSLTPRSSRLVVRGLGGANYASGGAGILDSTFAGTNIPLSKQVRNFGATRAQMVASLGSTAANDLLSKSLFLIAIGTNDMAAFAITHQQQQGDDALRSLLASLPRGLAYSVGDLYGLMRATIADPLAAGLWNVDAACCGGGRLGAQSGCQPNSTLCADRRRYLFLDYGHPTQRGAELVATAFYDGPARFTRPAERGVCV